jgi:hypothetical protein
LEKRGQGSRACTSSKEEATWRPRLTSASAAGRGNSVSRSCEPTCTCTRAHTQAYARAYACTRVCIHEHMCIPVHAYVCTRVRARMDMCAHKHAHTRARAAQRAKRASHKLTLCSLIKCCPQYTQCSHWDLSNLEFVTVPYGN